jgi:hypothetical protein
MQKHNNITKIRKVENDINPLFVNRGSPRAMSGEEISHDDLRGLFEAARWAPSSYNNQPWRSYMLREILIIGKDYFHF